MRGFASTPTTPTTPTTRTARTTLAAGFLLALLFVPAASAEYYEGKPDCPPEQLCTESLPGGEPAVASSGHGAVGFLALGGLAALAAVLAVRRR